MEKYAPNMMELASRDVVSRAEQTEINAGNGINGCVMLDCTPPGRVGWLWRSSARFAKWESTWPGPT